VEGDAGRRVELAQIEDQLREILDAVDVVVDGRRDERDAGLCVAEPGDLVRDFRGRQLSALARLRSLRDLDLQLGRGAQVAGRDAESRGRHLLDGAAAPLASGFTREAFGRLSAFAAVAAPAHALHRDAPRLLT